MSSLRISRVELKILHALETRTFGKSSGRVGVYTELDYTSNGRVNITCGGIRKPFVWNL